MENVVSLADHRLKNEPHIAGEARCVQCGHEWVAVCPAGTTELECPQCKTNKGVLKFSCAPADGEVWACNCGCDIFRITRDETICYKCGVSQNF